MTGQGKMQDGTGGKPVVENTNEACLEESRRQLFDFAAAVAHDFNNVLGSISVFSQLMQAGCSQAETLEYSGHILAACRLGQNFTSNLRVFSRPAGSHLAPVDLCAIVLAMEDLFELIVGDEISVDLDDLMDRSLLARADSRQVEQILINMAVNAREAMPDGGVFSFSCRRETVAVARNAASGRLDPGEYVVLCVRDEGRGIDEANRARIFDPFFTSKQSKNNVGLGLAVAASIMKSHNGCIDLISRPGEGSMFLLYFPTV